jgi:cytochrome c oxidase cbb3-type subunit 3
VSQQKTQSSDQEPPTTGHEWDGIKEFDNPLPRWWLWTFYACILWAVGYWILMPSWPLVSDYTKGVLGFSQRMSLEREMAAVRKQRAAYALELDQVTLSGISDNPRLLEVALAGGRSAFAVNCSQCHGRGAAGSKAYPNLNDDAWLWGGSLKAIHDTIRFGIRSDHEETRLSDMPAFGKDEILNVAQIGDVVAFVLTLSRQSADQSAAKRGAAMFAEQCAACHKETGKGNAEFGAPDLTDAIWLYGSDRKSILETVTNGRGGVMPAWEGRLDPLTIKQLAVYVHSLGGGQ